MLNWTSAHAVRLMLALWLRMVLSTATAATYNRPPFLSPSSTPRQHQSKSAANIFQLEDICRSSNTEIFVQDAATVTWRTEMDETALDDSHSSHNNSGNSSMFKVPSLTSPRCQITFNLSPEQGAFLFVTLQNQLPVNRDRCMAWNPMLRLRSHKQILPLGCVRSTSRFFDPPLTLIVNLFGLRPLLETRESGSFTLTVTAVTFECTTPTAREILQDRNHDDHSPSWWPCSLHEKYCIQRQLFCDSVNNCGDHEDEDVRLCSSHFSDGADGTVHDPKRLAAASTDQSGGGGGGNAVLRQILRQYKKDSSFAFSLVSPDGIEHNPDSSGESDGSWQEGYIPVMSGFFGFLAVTGVICFVYVWWTKHRNQRLKRNFIDYVIKYRRRAASMSGNRLGMGSGQDSYPQGFGEINNFVTASEEPTPGVEWTAEHRSLLGRRR